LLLLLLLLLSTCRHLVQKSCWELFNTRTWHKDHFFARLDQRQAAEQRWAATETAEASSCTGGTGDASACPRSVSAGQHDSASSSSQGAAQWPSNGPCDWHPDCRLCREEQQKAQCQPDSSSSSRGMRYPVPYDDPFLLRRLLWRLLGKLSPEAQSFLHARMCPHCDDEM
jgi:hypothetical protein